MRFTLTVQYSNMARLILENLPLNFALPNLNCYLKLVTVIFQVPCAHKGVLHATLQGRPDVHRVRRHPAAQRRRNRRRLDAYGQLRRADGGI